MTSAYHPNSNTKTTRKSEININLYITTTLNTNNIPLSSSFSETHKTTLKLTLPIQSLAKHAGNWKFTARFKVMQQKWIMKRHKWFSVSVMKSWKKDLCSAFISEQAAKKKKKKITFLECTTNEFSFCLFPCWLSASLFTQNNNIAMLVLTWAQLLQM